VVLDRVFDGQEVLFIVKLPF